MEILITHGIDHTVQLPIVITHNMAGARPYNPVGLHQRQIKAASSEASHTVVVVERMDGVHFSFRQAE